MSFIDPIKRDSVRNKDPRCKLGSVKSLYYNCIKHIELPSGIETLELKNNLLLGRTYLVFPECLEVMKLKRCYGLEHIHPRRSRGKT